MKLEEFWERLLNLEGPWEVSDVSLRVVDEEQEVHIRIAVPMGSPVRYPECRVMCKAHDRIKDRVWRERTA